MNTRSTTRFIMISLLVTATLSMFGCKNKKAGDGASSYDMEGNWKYTDYHFGTTDVLEPNDKEDSFHSNTCNRDFKYTYKTKTSWIINFAGNKAVTRTREDVITHVDTLATEKSCSLQYTSNTKKQTFSGTWKFSDDGKNLLVTMPTLPGGTGVSVNSGPAMNYYTYEITKVSDKELKLKELTSTEEITIAKQ